MTGKLLYVKPLITRRNSPVSFYDGAFRIALQTNTPILPVLFPDTVNRFHYSSFWKWSMGKNRAVFLKAIEVDASEVLIAFEEAIKCHSNSCFIASAIMIRKTLEEICIDRGAIGKNLFKKLEDLGSKILIPQELLIGMNELRLLGNDAAHIEAQTFSEIGNEEIEVSLEFAKEILKAVYQYENLLQKLKKLKEKINSATELKM